MIIALLAACFIGATFSAPTGEAGPEEANNGFYSFIKEANEAKKSMSAMSPEEQTAVAKVFSILSNLTANSTDKMAAIDELMKDAPKESQAEVHEMALKSTQLCDWLTERLKKEDPTVAKVATSLIQLMLNVEFLMSSDSTKQTEVDNLTKGLTKEQLAAWEQLDKDTSAKEKELGLD